VSGGKVRSFELDREKLLRAMSSTCDDVTKSQSIPFDNDEVPTFLRRLAKLKEAARKAQFVVR
jgi:hypothetical protein